VEGMIKKYVMIISVLLVMLMFTSTSTASFVFSNEKIYKFLPENLVFREILDKFSQIASDNDDGEHDGENDDEYDDGDADDENDDEYDDGPEKDVLLPKIWEEGFYWTPDDGNEPVDDSDVDDGGAVWNNGTVDSDGDEGVASNEITIPDYIDKGEWTVDLDRVVEIVTEHNVKIGAMLQRVIKRTITTNGEGGTVKNDIVGHVIDTDGN